MVVDAKNSLHETQSGSLLIDRSRAHIAVEKDFALVKDSYKSPTDFAIHASLYKGPGLLRRNSTLQGMYNLVQQEKMQNYDRFERIDNYTFNSEHKQWVKTESGPEEGKAELEEVDADSDESFTPGEWHERAEGEARPASEYVLLLNRELEIREKLDNSSGQQDTNRPPLSIPTFGVIEHPDQTERSGENSGAASSNSTIKFDDPATGFNELFKKPTAAPKQGADKLDITQVSYKPENKGYSPLFKRKSTNDENDSLPLLTVPERPKNIQATGDNLAEQGRHESGHYKEDLFNRNIGKQ